MLAAKGGFKTSKTFVYRLLKKALVVPMYIRWGGVKIFWILRNMNN
jgi:hypothetical protein